MNNKTWNSVAAGRGMAKQCHMQLKTFCFASLSSYQIDTCCRISRHSGIDALLVV
jgi:hypothetical protein